MLSHLHPLLGDRPFLKLLYPLRTSERLNLKNPATFNEKLQYLKLHRRVSNPERYVDKIEAKKTVAEMIGDRHVLPLLGCWDDARDIDFGSLPLPCVLKPSHYGGGAGIVFLDSPQPVDRQVVTDRLNRSLKENVYRRFGEYPFKNVRPRILAEPMLIPRNGMLNDYKFFCFNGTPLLLKVDSDRFGRHAANYFSSEWQPLDIRENEMPPSHEPLLPPRNFDRMTEIAATLSEGFPFVRIDLYNCDGKIYFGEYTFFPASGLGDLQPRKAQLMLGELIDAGTGTHRINTDRRNILQALRL